MRKGWVYMMANTPNGTLYTGVTSQPAFRIAQHKRGEGSAFCKRYGLRRLVYIEEHERIADAIAREKAIKAWNRSWKIRLISETNPEWHDLYDGMNW